MGAVAYTRDLFTLPEIRIEGLYDFQYRAIRYMMSARRCINAADKGLGKSVMCSAVIDALDLFPAVIVCPAAVKLKWAGEITYWLKGQRSVTVLQGRTPTEFEGEYLETYMRTLGNIHVPVNDLNADVIIVNYSIAWDWAERLAQCKNRVLVMDEAHKVKDKGTFQYKACKYLAGCVELTNSFQHIYALTGTTVVNRPSDLIGILDVLGRLSDFGGWYNFAKKFCNLHRKKIAMRNGREKWVLDYSGSRNEELLHQSLKNRCMYRIALKDALPELPPKVRSTVPVELSNRLEYNKAERDLIAYVRQLAIANKKFNAELNALSYWELRNRVSDEFLFSIEGLEPEEQMPKMREYLRHKNAQSAEYRARRAPALAQINILRILTARGKLKAEIDWIRDFRETNPTEKVILFVHHKDLQNALIEAFPNAAVIVGGGGDQARERANRRFQNDPDCLEIIVSMEAGGEGLDLTAAYNCLILEYPWTPKTLDQAEGRAYGRLVDPHSITAWYFIAPNSLDEHMLGILERKLEIASKIQDGKAADRLISDKIEDDLIELLMKRYAD